MTTMKKLTTLLVAMIIAISAMAQTPEVAYCSIWGGDKMGYIKGRVFINYGQDDTRHNWLVDDKGEVIHFATLIQAANYLAKYGWRIIETDRADIDTIILEKKISSPEDITEGILTREMYVEQMGM